MLLLAVLPLLAAADSVPPELLALSNFGVLGILAYLFVTRKLITPGELAERVQAERANAETWKCVAEIHQARADRAEQALAQTTEQGQLAISLLQALKNQGGKDGGK